MLTVVLCQAIYLTDVHAHVSIHLGTLGNDESLAILNWLMNNRLISVIDVLSHTVEVFGISIHTILICQHSGL